jgi:hypothetical protein
MFKQPDFLYDIHPANVEAKTEINAFVAAPAACIIQYKYTFDTANPLALGLLLKEAATTNLGVASAFALTQSTAVSKVKMGFKYPVHFAGPEYHALVGVHPMTLEISLKDFPSFDYFLKVAYPF